LTVDALCEDYVNRFLEHQMRDRVAEAAYEHLAPRGAARAG